MTGKGGYVHMEKGVQAVHSTSTVDKVLEWLQNEGLDGILLRKRSNFSWLTEGKVNHIVHTTEYGVADLLLLDGKKYCITVKMESRRIMEEELVGLGYELVECEWYESTDQLITELCRDRKVAADTAFLAFRDVSSDLVKLRSVLSGNEMERYKWLCQFTAHTLENVCREIEPGMSEHEIAALIASKSLKVGVNPQVILVATDDRIYHYRHPIPTDKKLEKYAMLVICAEKWGLVANVTRFVHFGELPLSLSENKEKLAKIDVIMNTITRPGMKINAVFQEAIHAYMEAGYSEDWRLLHQGGLTGYASREYLATMHTEEKIMENQAFAWNPAIRGIKSEDTILVGASENTFLTHTDNWTYIEVKHEGKVYQRPDILIR